jgi:ANTAR domain
LVAAQVHVAQQMYNLALIEIAKTRSVIDQAKGIVMVGAGCDAEEAFAILQKSSSHLNIKLNELSRRLVDRASCPRAHQDLPVRLRDVLNLMSEPEPSDLGPLSPA